MPFAYADDAVGPEPPLQDFDVIENILDNQGRPTGGRLEAVGLTVRWQDGAIGDPPDRSKINGTFLETLMRACLQRLRFYQVTGLGCAENDETVRHLEAALAAQARRVAERRARGVQGRHAP